LQQFEQLLALAEAKTNGACMTGTALIEQYYGRIAAAGHGRWDNTALIVCWRGIERRALRLALAEHDAKAVPAAQPVHGEVVLIDRRNLPHARLLRQPDE
jgi:hypothetical protein